MATGAWKASMPMKCMDQMAPARHSPPSSPQTRRMLRLRTLSRCLAMVSVLRLPTLAMT